jgi:hypothetical protein
MKHPNPTYRSVPTRATSRGDSQTRLSDVGPRIVLSTASITQFLTVPYPSS